MTESVCPGCGLIGPIEEGPTHAYMLASPLCWRRFNAIMTREYETPALMPTHFLAVDAYAAQHPGDSDEPRARQSVWIHLAGLVAVLREGHAPEYRYDLLRRLARDVAVFPPPPSHAPFPIVANDVAAPHSLARHSEAMREWAEATVTAYETASPDLARQIETLR